MNMRGLWLENQVLSVRSDLPVPEPAVDEALLRLRLAGICGTDLEMVRGYYPFTGVLGHEFVADVVKLGSSDQEAGWLGKRVVGEINLVCGLCEQCRSGRSTHCEHRSTLGIRDRWGAFAEYLTLPLRNLHAVPANVPDEAAVFTEPLAAALEILEQVQLHPDDRVLLVGAGRLGQLIAQVLALSGCGLRVVARHAAQAELLRRHDIRVIDAGEVPEQRFDLVVEATGSPSGYELARRAVRPRGTIVLKSTYHGSLQVDFSELVVREITLVGSRCGPFEPALGLLASGRIDPLPLIASRFSLGDGQEAFSQAGRSGMLKVLLEPSGG